MAGTTSFELVTPDRLLLSEDVGMVVIPGADGDFGVMERHSAFLSSVRPGVLKVYKAGLSGGVTNEIFVAGGFAEVTPERCTIMAEEATSVADITVDGAAKRLADAEAALASASNDGEKNIAAREVVVATAMVKAVH